MNYTCTRDNSISISASKAILVGISPDGGLFLPEEFPKVSLDDISKMRSMTYPERAAYIICLFLTDFTNDELKAYTAAAYSKSRFGEQIYTSGLKVFSSFLMLVRAWYAVGSE